MNKNKTYQISQNTLKNSIRTDEDYRSLSSTTSKNNNQINKSLTPNKSNQFNSNSSINEYSPISN